MLKQSLCSVVKFNGWRTFMTYRTSGKRFNEDFKGPFYAFLDECDEKAPQVKPAETKTDTKEIVLTSFNYGDFVNRRYDLTKERTITHSPGGLFFTDSKVVGNQLSKHKRVVYIKIEDDAKVDVMDNGYATDLYTLSGIVNICDMPEWYDSAFCFDAVKHNLGLLEYVKKQNLAMCIYLHKHMDNIWHTFDLKYRLRMRTLGYHWESTLFFAMCPTAVWYFGNF